MIQKSYNIKAFERYDPKINCLIQFLSGMYEAYDIAGIQGSLDVFETWIVGESPRQLIYVGDGYKK